MTPVRSQGRGHAYLPVKSPSSRDAFKAEGGNTRQQRGVWTGQIQQMNTRLPNEIKGDAGVAGLPPPFICELLSASSAGRRASRLAGRTARAHLPALLTAHRRRRVWLASPIGLASAALGFTHFASPEGSFTPPLGRRRRGCISRGLVRADEPLLSETLPPHQQTSKQQMHPTSNQNTMNTEIETKQKIPTPHTDKNSIIKNDFSSDPVLARKAWLFKICKHKNGTAPHAFIDYLLL